MSELCANCGEPLGHPEACIKNLKSKLEAYQFDLVESRSLHARAAVELSRLGEAFQSAEKDYKAAVESISSRLDECEKDRRETLQTLLEREDSLRLEFEHSNALSSRLDACRALRDQLMAHDKERHSRVVALDVVKRLTEICDGGVETSAQNSCEHVFSSAVVCELCGKVA